MRVSVLEINDAFKQLHLLNESTHSLAGPLFAVKDVLHVDGHTTACESNLLIHFFRPQGGSVTKLSKAGAVLVGKTVTANFVISDPVRPNFR